MRKPNYDKFPFVAVPRHENRVWEGWERIADRLSSTIARVNQTKSVLCLETYTGVLEDDIERELVTRLKPALVVRASDLYLPEERIDELTAPFLGGDDPIFGYMSNLKLSAFFDPQALGEAQRQVEAQKQGLVLIIGTGASHVHEGDVLIYADLARWEAQLRMRRNEIANLGATNHTLKWSLQYKRAFFNDWRVCDRWKKPLLQRVDFFLDTNRNNHPKLAEGSLVRAGIRQAVRQPFRVVPFFDPAPWGGQWMKEACDLPRETPNYGWCFDCVPEENSLLLGFGDVRFEIPSINVVFMHPAELLGDPVHARFGDEFPIRFDFLDTIGGGNLSFQVHPLTEFIQEHFGMNYTQDESYYILAADENATVYLGVKDEADPKEVIQSLRDAEMGKKPFDDERFVNRFPAKKHDHFLIPAGTVHCSGKGCMVLEISATPYIFTFKLWDWGRLGLDGLPRPINLDRGSANIQWNRDTAWCRSELVNCFEPLEQREGMRSEKTGLHKREFIETHRHWFTDTVHHQRTGSVEVLNLVEGEEALVESPDNAFEPFVVHYAETFILPDGAGDYTITPFGLSEGKECGTVKAFVRH